MHRRVRHRKGAVAWVLLALGLLLLLHAMFGSGGSPPGPWTVVSGQVVTVSPTSVTVRLNGSQVETPPVDRSMQLSPGTRVVLFQSGGPPVPRVLLEAGSRVRVLAQRLHGRLVARRIAIRGTVMTGQLQGWGPGRIAIVVPEAGSPINVAITPSTIFRFQTSDPGVVRSGIAVTAVVRAMPDGGWTAISVRIGS